MPEINFPAINGTDGSSCDVYSFGFTSGCTNADGTNRGFTQDWFFDGTIGAWVSVTVGSTGGGAIIDGFTYDSLSHKAPVMTGTGNLRQIAFLDPDTGGLTFDYIRTYDVINPIEDTYRVTGFQWLGHGGYLTANSLQNNNRNLTTGVTLCADNSYQYVFGSLTDTSVGFKWYINRTSESGDFPSSFAPPPVNGAPEFLLSYAEVTSDYTVGDVTGTPNDRNVPFMGGTYAFAEYSNPDTVGNTGEIILDSGNNDGPVIGFTTAGGPIVKSFQPLLKHTKVPGVNDPVNDTNYATEEPSGVRFIRHENWIYFASVMSLSGAVADKDAALSIVTASNGDALKLPRTGIVNNTQLYGSRVLLDPMLNNSSSQFNGEITTSNGATVKAEYDLLNYELDAVDFGPDVVTTTPFYPIIAIPTRALPVASTLSARRQKFIDGIFQIGTNGAGNGFSIAGVSTVDITNERNFVEEYTVFCSEQPGGIGPSTPNFRLTFDYT